MVTEAQKMLKKKGSPQRLEVIKDLRNFRKKCKDDACQKMKQVQDHAQKQELKFDEIKIDHE